MFSDTPPQIVMPDTQVGRQEAAWKFPGVRVGFCGDYAEDYYNSRMCGNRQLTGDRRHNWCVRCPCGFIALGLSAKEQEATRLGDFRLSS